MCGKFTQMASWAEVVAFSQALGASPPGPESSNDAVLTSTPMRLAHIIRLAADGRREAVPMRWGFVDHHPGACDIPKHMHARAETIDRLPTFSAAFAERRAILLVGSFNEGEEVPVHYDDGEPSGRLWTRQWTLRARDSAPLAFAVVWETASVQGRPLPTFVQVTTPANALIAPITDRMPAFLDPADWAVWLGETPARPPEVKALLRTHNDAGAWEMTVENPAKKPPRPRNPKPKPGGLI